MKKTFAIHPFLLAVYPVIFLFSQNISQIPFSDILKPLAITIASAVIGWCILNIFLKNWQKSAVIVSLFLFLFFSFGRFRTYIEPAWLVWLFSITWITIFVSGFYFIAKNKKPFRKATIILNIIAFVLTAIPATNIIIYQFTETDLLIQDAGTKNQVKDNANSRLQQHPDIYFIILDAYARADILKDIYDFDNSDFLNFLTDKGFYIPEKATSNYCQTSLSIASCFNLMYLDKLVEKIGKYNPSFKPARELCSKGLIKQYLRDKGYKIVNFSPSPVPAQLQATDIHLHRGVSINEFQHALKNITPLPDVMKIKKSDDAFDDYRRKILYMLDSLEELPRLNRSPKFVHLNLKIPHPPFIFGANGEPIKAETRFNDHDGDWLIRPGRLTKAQYQKYYTEQIIFLNTRIKKVVNKILAESAVPPIIMLIADHGPRSEMVWKSPDKTNVKECMSIFSAYHMPGGGSEKLYPQISLVNIFRVIVNHYFDEKLELLPDKNYFSTPSYRHNFYDVTERVQR